MSPPARDDPPASLKRHLEQLKQLRGAETRAGTPPRLVEVKGWQADRLARTYRDLAVDPRYGRATEFFLDDLYGVKDFSSRDDALLRIYPVLVRTLPDSAVKSAALAVEVDALSEDLDRRLAARLGAERLDEEAYAKAYRESSNREERLRQIELIDAVGHHLDRLVMKPFVYATLKLMRGPAALAGMQDLQSFLERGFEAFRHMGGAEHFLSTIGDREKAILKRLFSGHPSPFSG